MIISTHVINNILWSSSQERCKVEAELDEEKRRQDALPCPQYGRKTGCKTDAFMNDQFRDLIAHCQRCLFELNCSKIRAGLYDKMEDKRVVEQF